MRASNDGKVAKLNSRMPGFLQKIDAIASLLSLLCIVLAQEKMVQWLLSRPEKPDPNAQNSQGRYY